MMEKLYEHINDKRIAKTSPRLKARLAGVLYLLTSVVAFDEFSVLGPLVVHDDPTATAANILAHRNNIRHWRTKAAKPIR